MVDMQKLRNPFLWISIFLPIVGLVAGNHFINDIYKPSFPYSDSASWSNEYKVDITCGSLRGYEVPVFGDFFNCNTTAMDLNPSDKYPISNTEYSVKALILHYPKSQVLKEPGWETVGSLSYKNKEKSSEFYDIRVPIEAGFNEFYLQFYLTYLDEENREISYYYYSPFIRYEAIGLEEYNRRQGEKNALRFAVFTFVLTFSFIGVRNLMAIWDRKQK